MIVRETALPGVLVLEPRVFGDQRGYFFETWSEQRYREVGIERTFVQDNVSSSCRGILRGLHYQYPQGQGKLVQVLAGEVYDVVVDIRVGSPTFGQWVALTLTSKKHEQLYIPPGFAHGFYVLSEQALFCYKCTDYYNPQTEGGIAWNDPDIGIEWPLSGGPLLSGKDAEYGPLSAIPPDQLPTLETPA